MSSERVPSRSEVMGWGPYQLSEYLRKMNLSGCDKVVLKNSISGSRFVNMSENDLQKFPKLHAPLISKISAEISKDEKRGIFRKKVTPKYQEPETTAESQGWGEDEFDEEEFDDDYESPYSADEGESTEDYESPNDDMANDYEPPPSQPSEELKVGPSLPIGDSDYIDNRNSHASFRGPPPAVTPRPSAPSPRMPRETSRRDNSPHTDRTQAGKFLAPPPQISRENKPGRQMKSTPSPIRGAHQSPVDRPSPLLWKSQPDPQDLPAWSKPPALPPSNTSVARSNTFSKLSPSNKFDVKRELPHNDGPKHNTFPLHNKKLPPSPGPPGPPSHHGDSSTSNFPTAGSLPHKLQSAIAEQRGSFREPPTGRQSFNSHPTSTANTQELDPRWYVGQVSRGQAEGCLRDLHKDGAYLVRDSMRQLAGQPFTLMVFYQEKVYNIQIRQQNQQFLLGTGLKFQEPFPSVRDIIYHYSQFPLLLIDAKKRNMNQQNQCLLSDPAGYLMMTGQNWT
ncbi:lymphocyte cytosolic protein 2a isoform X2 [Takifugu rubripes]|uniref:lymphocyte cytosolic protein 2a isoform X2 n=1 Tax=Takifugu rubripes TaxID=31033 RepID=UPI0005D252BA|nr:lymphocyte cytosolic protein 2 isoform X2 [Takifugu rubripes]|eukprot:XP_011609519.1 PREDICTED: lymphocyte cytosolic protein 2 isoform X2 [Takifugu rubripes]